MNSEELEQSLRAEFENYLKDVVADIRQSVSDFQEKINADFDKHKEQLAESLRELDQKVGSDKELEVSFTESVAEHLKLARDEGASITAAAIAEAEKLAESDDEGPDFYNLSRAIDDISSKDSQSEILKALVNHAAEFTPRGAFFIVKNEHLVGWRVFGREDHEDPKVVREVFFPVATNTALSAAVDSLSTVSNVGSDSEDDVMYRNKLGFQNPERMFAVPLIARGRGVAVLYADSGAGGHSVNIAAIEALMKVAGLTVEVLASAPQIARKVESDDASAHTEHTVPEADTESAEPAADEYDTSDFADADDSSEGGFVSEYESAEVVAVEEAVENEDADSYQFQPVAPAADFEPVAEHTETVYEEAVEEPVIAEEVEFEAEEHSFQAPETVPASEYDEASFDAGHEEAPDVNPWNEPAPAAEPSDAFSHDESFASDFEAADEPVTAFEAYDSGIDEPYVEPDAKAEIPETYDFETGDEAPEFEESVETPVDSAFDDFDDSAVSFEAQHSDSDFKFDQPVETFDEAATEELPMADTMAEEEPAVEAVPSEDVHVEEPAAPPVRSRFADRNLDLPIEVGEDERRLHNDARRFARLLVSEIKLYNEQKVKEGRESSDLYERLREAIDRSREMYDKRVQPPVAAKFDYFNYELVNTLAEGDEGKLGGSYPGAAV